MSSSESSSESIDIDSLDISNDQYYLPNLKTTLVSTNSPTNEIIQQHQQTLIDNQQLPKYGSKTITHNLAAYDLTQPFYPTRFSEERLRNLHRPKLKLRLLRQFGSYHTRSIEFVVKSLSWSLYQYHKRLRNRVARAINIGASEESINSYLQVRQPQDLTAKNGESFLFEYSEEFPPALGSVGMASNIKIYHRVADNMAPTLNKANASSTTDKTTETDSSQKTCPAGHFQVHGESVQSNGSCPELTRIGYEQLVPDSQSTQVKNLIYFSELSQKSHVQMIENNLYRAPIFQHDMPSNDFLIIKTKNSCYVRNVNAIFTVGQTFPLMTIPQPYQAGITKVRNELFWIYVNKLFKTSGRKVPEVKLEHLLKLFPDFDRKMILKRLRRGGCKYDPLKMVFYQGTSDYGKMSLKLLREKFTPEKYVIHEAMMAARQRLRDLKYHDSMIHLTDDREPEREVLAAPWNTTKAVRETLAGKCYLDLKGHLIDPTGPQGEGFSCVRWSRSTTEDQQEKERKKPDRPSTPFISPDTSSNGIQQVSTRNSPFIPAQNPLAHQITREKVERLGIFRKEAQLINDTQSRVLRSSEALSSDEDDNSDSDQEEENLLETSFDQQLQDLDRMVLAGKTVNELNFEKEEEDRLSLIKSMNDVSNISPNKTIDALIGGIINDNSPDGMAKANSAEVPINLSAFKHRVLKITRRHEGSLVSTEIIREPKVIALYVRQKGGALSSSQLTNCSTPNYSSPSKKTPSPRKMTQRIKIKLNRTAPSYFSCNNDSPSKKRRYSLSQLGPKELCRTDGIRMVISKSVLNQRALRKRQRDARLDTPT